MPTAVIRVVEDDARIEYRRTIKPFVETVSSLREDASQQPSLLDIDFDWVILTSVADPVYPTVGVSPIYHPSDHLVEDFLFELESLTYECWRNQSVTTEPYGIAEELRTEDRLAVIVANENAFHY